MFPERLKTLRKEAGLTQKELAEQIDTSQQNIGFWEKGDRNPKHKSLVKLANFFKVSTEYLTGETDIKNSEELSDADIKNILETGVASYDGKPISEHDAKILEQVIRDYFDGNLKDYD